MKYKFSFLLFAILGCTLGEHVFWALSNITPRRWQTILRLKMNIFFNFYCSQRNVVEFYKLTTHLFTYNAYVSLHWFPQNIGVRVSVRVRMRVGGVQGSLFYSCTEYFHSECYFRFDGVQWQSFCWGVQGAKPPMPPIAEEFGTLYEPPTLAFSTYKNVYVIALFVYKSFSQKDLAPFIFISPTKKPSFKWELFIHLVHQLQMFYFVLSLYSHSL